MSPPQPPALTPPHGAPPPLPLPLPPAPPTTPARWRSAIALLLLAAYVTVPALLGLGHDGGSGSMLPTSVPAVLVLCAVELGLFGIAFLLATALARFRAPELLLTTPLRWWAWPRAIAWSIALRIGVAILLICGLAALQLARGEPFHALDPAIARPKVEAIVNTAALRDPLYLVLMLTVVSFILAGLREELWRVGMIALLARLAPSCFGGRLGPWLALVPVAILFGLGHTPQGWAGVAATTVLGLGLGAIMLLHRSLWDAVLAHGFFNATTFALLPWIAHLIPQARG